MMNKTKIVATMGPACKRVDVLEAMIEAGMNVARINASHADAEEIPRQVELLRRAARNKGKEVGILLDLKGPKIRVGDIRGVRRPSPRGRSSTSPTGR